MAYFLSKRLSRSGSMDHIGIPLSSAGIVSINIKCSGVAEQASTIHYSAVRTTDTLPFDPLDSRIAKEVTTEPLRMMRPAVQSFCRFARHLYAQPAFGESRDSRLESEELVRTSQATGLSVKTYHYR